MGNHRGIIIAPEFTFDGKVLRLVHSYIKPQMLKYYALYWDKIEYPQAPFIETETKSDEQFLMDAGILTRTQVQLRGFSGNVGNAYILAQPIVFQIKNQEEPGCWSIAQKSNCLYFHENDSVQENTVEIELYNALPAPGEDVSLDDVLTFKDRRRPELLTLRSELDKLYLEIINSRDIPRSKIVAITKIENALKDLNAVARESWKSVLLKTFQVLLNITDLIIKTGGGMVLAKKFDFDPKIGAAIGGISHFSKYTIGKRPKIKGLSAETHVYTYLYAAERDLT